MILLAKENSMKIITHMLKTMKAYRKHERQSIKVSFREPTLISETLKSRSSG